MLMIPASSCETTYQISGDLVGPIWQPGFDECEKPLFYDLTDEAKRMTPRATLRDHMLAATHDGDFQHCAVRDGYLIVRRTYRTGAYGSVTRTRHWPLSRFPSIADMLAE